MDLSDLDCPQYVNFETEVLKSNECYEGLENSVLGVDAKDDASTVMDVESETSMAYDDQDQSIPSNLLSPYSESYLVSSSCGSPGNFSQKSSSGLDDYPVVRPKNLYLPDDATKKNSKPGKTTKVKPFNLHSTKKRKRVDEYISMAEQVAAFQKKTPARFHTNGGKAFQPTEHWSPTMVIPVSPKLRAAKRARTVNVLSHEEQEAMEAEEVRRYRFRARPINQNILKKPRIPKVDKKPSTKPKSIQLRTAQRAAEVYNKSKEEETPFEFHARPVPKAILNGPTGLKEKPILPVTEAKTPNFALKKRAEKWKSENRLNETVAETQTFKAAPPPPSSKPFVPKHEKKHTDIQPFSFETRDAERMKKKEQKIKEVIEKENAVYVFKAQLMPSPAPSALPPVPKKPPTQPEPFNFHLYDKSSKHSSFNSTMDQQQSSFKAQPATVLQKPPFIPEKSDKPPVEIKEFNLHTDVRASERLKLKELNDIKEREKELALQRMRELEEERERMEIAQLRKEIVHKAKPIRHFKPLEIKPSSKPPTDPKSPKFKTDQRLQRRTHE